MTVYDNLSDGFTRIISTIRKVSDIPTDKLTKLGDDNPGRHNLAVDRFTIGTKFFDPSSYHYGELYKRLLAKSFITKVHINLETLESKFQEWRAETFSRKEEVSDLDGIIKNDIYFSGEEISPADEKDNDDKYTGYNIVVECMFIIEVIRRKTWGYTQEAVYELGLLFKAQRDMLVVGNQLPFSVLQGIYNSAFPTHSATAEGNFFTVCTNFFEECMLNSDYSQTSQFPRQPPTTTGSSKLRAMKNATFLEAAGMAISPSPSDTSVCSLRYSRQEKHVCGLRYSKDVLEIPKVTINNMSIHVLKNMIEYEKRHYPSESFIIDYVHFMDKLIDKPRDVNVLIHNGILDNHLPKSKRVSRLFNNITKEAPLLNHNYYYHGISEAVNEYCDIPHHRWKAILRRDYCSSPWMVASTAAAILLLLLTLVQTVCSILSIK